MMTKLPEPDVLLEEIKSAVNDNEWSIRELVDLVDELTVFADTF